MNLPNISFLTSLFIYQVQKSMVDEKIKQIKKELIIKAFEEGSFDNCFLEEYSNQNEADVKVTITFDIDKLKTDIIDEETYLQQAKKRAIKYLDDYGDIMNAWQSFVSDLSKNSYFENHPGIKLGHNLMLIGEIASIEAMKKFIEKFN